MQNVRNGGQDEGAAYDIYKKTQLQLLKSNFVLSRAARKPEMAGLETMQEHKEDPVGFLESKLVVDYPGDAELMRVAIKGTHREELPIIVNSIVESYMDEIVNGDKVARLKQRDLLYAALLQEPGGVSHTSPTSSKCFGQTDGGQQFGSGADAQKNGRSSDWNRWSSSRNELMQRIRDQKLQMSLLEGAARPREPSTAAGPSMTIWSRPNTPEIPWLPTSPGRSPTCGWRSRSNRRCWPIRATSPLRNLRRQLGQLEDQIQERKAEIAAANRDKSAKAGPGGIGLGRRRPRSDFAADGNRKRVTGRESDDGEREDPENARRSMKNSTPTPPTWQIRQSTLEDLRAIIRRVGSQLYLWNIELEAEQRIKVVELGLASAR